jgi:hypothetical protein
MSGALRMPDCPVFVAEIPHRRVWQILMPDQVLEREFGGFTPEPLRSHQGARGWT